MMVTSIANPCRFEPITSAKMDELLHAQKTLHEVVREWCKQREPQPLSKSIWASDEVTAKPEDSAANAVNQPAMNQPAEGLATNSLVKKLSDTDDDDLFEDPLNTFGIFNPMCDVFRGVREPEEFMAHWRTMQMGDDFPTLQPPTGFVHRRIVFTNVPAWAKMNDMLCLVHGGDIERIWSEMAGEVKVDFLEAHDCEQYYETYAPGIRIGTHVIHLDLEVCEVVSQALRSRIGAGNTRVVYVDVPVSKTIQELETVAQDLALDHMVYHLEHGKPHRAYYFFCKIEHGHAMMRRLLQPGWIGTHANFLPDPCGLARGFHANSVAASPMLSAVAVEPLLPAVAVERGPNEDAGIFAESRYPGHHSVPPSSPVQCPPSRPPSVLRSITKTNGPKQGNARKDSTSQPSLGPNHVSVHMAPPLHQEDTAIREE
ncbi:uncharacterized protein N7459_005227 [Penicillium hispanicum]|uniref:uncharacterized protein n=1 Tax=Penicillium hispanicum TaxID=1080232 RepID=UPI00254158BB|nr:uncharacterized protein N7459_005227 [Penicillium hispanicum]KAJ5585427.1 hypothetical protein N7459_005227 [Penicillium hispanicum]